MLSEGRTNGNPYNIPEFTVETKDVESFVDELRAFHSEFTDCFQRSETRENFYRYSVGQFSKLERKSIEPIALAVEGGKVRSMQRAISDASWDETKMLSKYRSLLNDDMGDPEGTLIFDESSFQKKGADSVGVARQYCGSLGKVENCQVGVFSAYASRHGYALLDGKLFIPEKWFGDDYAERRKKCKVPEDAEFKTKPQLAAEMLDELREQKVLPFKYIVADSLYGSSPEFVEAAERCTDKIYFLAVHGNTLCWLKKPIIRQKRYRYGGAEHTKTVLEKTEKKPIAFSEVAENMNDYFWYKRKVSEGTKGPIEYEFTRRRVVLAKEGLPCKEVWLVIRRTRGDAASYRYYISNASNNVRLPLFVWLSGLRWAIEQCFEEAKSELGMDHYEVRKYGGWRHHILTCILAHFFLWHIKIRLGKKSTSHYAFTT